MKLEPQKPNAIPSHNLFAGISKTLRLLEICIVLIFLSWTLPRLPLAVTVSADFLRRLAASPLFIFAVSNAIIAALIAQSGGFSGECSADQTGADGIYREIMNNRVNVNVTVADREDPPPTAVDPSPRRAVNTSPPPAEVECHVKDVISEKIVDSEAGAGSDLANYRRSQSEKWKKGDDGKMVPRKELRRSETEKVKVRGNLYPQDKLSNEEFQREIEAFIAKQKRFMREESSGIVLHNTA